MGEATPPLHPALERWAFADYGSHRLRDSYWLARAQEDPYLRNAIPCVELVLGGDRVVRVATQRVEATSGTDGRRVVYDPALLEGAAIDLSYTVGESASGARSIDVAFPNDLLDAITLVKNGRYLGGFGEYALVVDGGDWDHRLRVMRGDVDAGVEGGVPEGSFIRTTLSDPVDTADLSLPPWCVDSDRWPNAREAAAGVRYPVVAGGYEAIPALPVNDSSLSGNEQFLACYGHGWSVDTVYVEGDSVAPTDTEYTWAASETYDARGTPVTIITFAGTHTWDGSESVNVTVSGGKYGNSPVDAAEWLVREFTGLGVRMMDEAAWGEAKARLGSLPMRILANASGSADAVRVLEFVEGSLACPFLSFAWGLGGYGPILTDRRDTRYAAHLTAGAFPLLGRATFWRETAKRDLRNSFTLRYNLNVLDNEYRAVVTRDAQSSDLCALSVRHAGLRTEDPIECPFVVLASTAEFWIDWLVSHKTLPSLYLEYPATPWVLLWLRRGQNVWLVDDYMGITGCTATVERIAWKPGGMATLGLRAWWGAYNLGGGSVAGGAATAAQP